MPVRIWVRARLACLHSAFCILHSSGAPARRTAQALTSADPRFAPTSSPSLRQPGVSRASWGIVVESLDRPRSPRRSEFAHTVRSGICREARQRRHRGRGRRLGLSIRDHSPHHGLRLSGNALRRSDHRRVRRSFDWRARRRRPVSHRRCREGRRIRAHRGANHRRRRCARGASASALLGLGRPRLHDGRPVRGTESCGESNRRDSHARALGRSPGDAEPRPARQWDAPLLNRIVTGAAGHGAIRVARAASRRAVADHRWDHSARCASRCQLGISTGNPTLWFASVLRNRLIEEGITVTGEAVDVDDVVSCPGSSRTPRRCSHTGRPHSPRSRVPC